jgi:hypothetical protein
MADKKYKLTDPNGKSIVIISDHSPNDEEAQDLFGQYHQQAADENKKKTADIRSKTEAEINKIPMGRFASQHPMLSRTLEATSAMGGGVAEGITGLAKMPFDVVKGLYQDIKSPVESAKLLGHGIAHPSEVSESIPFAPQAKELISPTEPYGRFRSAGQIYGMGVLGAGVGAAMRGTPIITPEVMPPDIAPPEFMRGAPQLSEEIPTEVIPQRQLTTGGQKQLPEIIKPPEIPKEVKPEPPSTVPEAVPRLKGKKTPYPPPIDMQKAGPVTWPKMPEEMDVTKIPHKPGVLTTPAPKAEPILPQEIELPQAAQSGKVVTSPAASTTTGPSLEEQFGDLTKPKPELITPEVLPPEKTVQEMNKETLKKHDLANIDNLSREELAPRFRAASEDLDKLHEKFGSRGPETYDEMQAVDNATFRKQALFDALNKAIRTEKPTININAMSEMPEVKAPPTVNDPNYNWMTAPFRGELLDIQSPKINPEQMVKQAGGEFKGIEEGMIWFNDPQTGSTLVVPEGSALEDIQNRIAQSRETFKGQLPDIESPVTSEGKFRFPTSEEISSRANKTALEMFNKSWKDLTIEQRIQVSEKSKPNWKLETTQTSQGQLPQITSPEMGQLPENLPQVKLPPEIAARDFSKMDDAELFRRLRFNPEDEELNSEWERRKSLTSEQREFVKKGGTIKKVPPAESPEPLEFGKPFEELRDKIRKSEERSDKLLNLLKDEEGTFNPKRMLDYIRSIGKDNDFKTYIEGIQDKLARGEKLSPELMENLKGSKLRDVVFTYQDKVGALNKAATLFGSYDRNMEDNPWTAPIAEIIKGTGKQQIGEIPKEIWKSHIYQAVDQIRGKFLSSKDREQVGVLLDNFQDIPINLEGFSSKALDVTDGYRKLLDSIWEFAQERGVTTRSGKMPGTIKEYFSHIQDDPSIPEEIKASISALFDPVARGAFKDMLRGNISKVIGTEQIPLSGKQVGEQVFVQPKPTPSSKFVEKRTGALKDIEYNSDHVMRAYIESLASLIFDKPAVIQAREVLARIPEGTLKRNATSYIRDYAGFDALDLSGTLKNLESKVAKIGSRSILPFSTNLQLLHLARSVGQVIPEGLSHGVVPVVKGLMNFAKNPIAAVKEAHEMGMIQQYQVPFSMKTLSEEFDQTGNFGDAGNSIAKAFALKVGQEIYPNEPKKAIDWAMRAEGAITPGRQVEVFTKPGTKLLLQFKGWLQKYGEQFVGAQLRALDKPSLNHMMSAIAYPASLAGLLYLTDKLGVRLAHLGFESFQIGSPAGQALSRTMKLFAKGETEQGIIEFLKFFTPMGQSAPVRLLQKSGLMPQIIAP